MKDFHLKILAIIMIIFGIFGLSTLLRKEPLNIENRIGHAYPTSLYRLVYDRVAESHFVR